MYRGNPDQRTRPEPASGKPARGKSARGDSASGKPARGQPQPRQPASRSQRARSQRARSQPANGGEGGVFRIYCCATDPRSLHPQAASGSDEISIIGGIQRGLLYYNQDLTLRPELATDMPTISDDGLTYTFTLGDHNYSDGTPIVAGDYVRAVRQLADPRNAFDYGYEACWIAGVDDILGADFGCSTDSPAMALPADPAQYFTGTPEDQAIDAALQTIGVAAPDDHTVVYTLKTPTSFFTNLVAMWLFTPVPESQTTWAEAADIKSSGPFMLQSWTHNCPDGARAESRVERRDHACA